MPAITAVNLRKVYRTHQKAPGLDGALRDLLRRQAIDRTAVDDVSFTIEEGEIVGFLGPNGAGKTTTIKLLCGLLYPSGGTATVLGHTPFRREPALLRRIALVLGQKNTLSWDLPAYETLLLARDIYGLPDAVFRSTLSDLADLLSVSDLLGVPVRKLSLGERMKLELLASLIHQPEVLFLDEPTIGLDVVAQQRVRDFLRDLNRAYGTTILLTSHYMADIEALCPRVLLIDHGRLRYDGALATLVGRVAPHKVLTAVFAAPLPPQARDELLQARGARWTLAPQPSDDLRQLRLHVLPEAVALLTARLAELGDIQDLSVATLPVEDAMRELFAQNRSTP